MKEFIGKVKLMMRIAVVLLVLAALGYVILRNCSMFNIDAIAVSGNQFIDSEEIIALSGIEYGQNLLAINTGEAQLKIKAHPLVKTVTVERGFPKKISICVAERQLWAIVRFRNEFLCLDNEGYCIDKEANIDIKSYVLISFDNLPTYATLGQPFEQAGVKAVYNVWQALAPAEREEISDYKYVTAEGSIVMYTNSGTEIRFGNLERQDEKIALLKKSLIMEKEYAASDKNAIEYIDLRFAGQPVVKQRQ